MRVADERDTKLGRGFVLLAPAHHPQSSSPRNALSRHGRLLAGAQRLRGRIYAEDGAIQPDQLTPDGRHVQDADDCSWHLLSVDAKERVGACLRFHCHTPGAKFSDLTLSASWKDTISDYAPRVRSGVQTQL